MSSICGAGAQPRHLTPQPQHHPCSIRQQPCAIQGKQGSRLLDSRCKCTGSQDSHVVSTSDHTTSGPAGTTKDSFQPLPGAAFTVTTTQVVCLGIVLNFGSLSGLAQLLGTDVLELDTRQVAYTAIVSDSLLAAGMFWLVRSALKTHDLSIDPWLNMGKVDGRALGITVGATAASIAAVAAVTSSLFDGAGSVNTTSAVSWFSGAEPDIIAALLMSNVVLGPVLEEVFFRGFVLSHFAAWYGNTAAVGLSSMLFAAYHVSGSDFLPLFALGAALGIAYTASGRSLLTAVCAHAVYNLLVLSLAIAHAEIHM